MLLHRFAAQAVRKTRVSHIVGGATAAVALAAFRYSTSAEQKLPKSIFDFKVKNIDGEMVDLSDFKNKVTVVVNVASK